jgi:hypothetical protein
MPMMPPNHAPDSEEWSNSIALCSIMRDENVTDVMEWLKYYQYVFPGCCGSVFAVGRW